MSRESPTDVIPAQAGIDERLKILDPRLRGDDEKGIIGGVLMCLFKQRESYGIR